MQDKKKECFGLFCCKESSIICCRGKLSSNKQREYVGNIQFAVADINTVRKMEMTQDDTTAHRAIQKNSHTERCCGIFFAPILLKKKVRIVTLIFYLLLIGVACYFASTIRVYFTERFFVSEESEVNDFFDKDELFFTQTGVATETYVENIDDSIDFSDLGV